MTRSQDNSEIVERTARSPAGTALGNVDGRADRSETQNIEPHGEERLLEVLDDAPPDPRAVIDDLRRRLRAEREKTLNSVDAVLGAQAAAAQARAETQDVFYRLHVRETELKQLKDLMADGEARAARGALTGPDGRPLKPMEAARSLLASVKRVVGDR